MLYISVCLRDDETGTIESGSLIASMELEATVRARMSHLGGEEPHEALVDLIRDPSGTNPRCNPYMTEEVGNDRPRQHSTESRADYATRIAQWKTSGTT